ncbi:MAG TPA: hypothetical protein VKZ68_01810 [Ohtaekwangia sp.]|nr:hypothetical protein [Ohtaekwangia sp.]
MMKDQQPDNLFRGKLAGYQRPVSANAWDRVESAMEQKTFPWLRVAVAASLILICGVAATLWLHNNSNTATVASNDQPKVSQPKKNDTPLIKEPVEEKKSAAPDSVEADHTPETPVTNKITSPSPTESNRKKNNPNTPSHQERVDAIVHESPALAVREEQDNKGVVDENPDLNEETLRTNDEQLIASNEKSQPASDTNESVTIIISAEETRAYLTKNVNTEATQEEKKTSTLKKVLRKASELKNNDQDPIGDFRQMKDELLALNFKSNKRGQNK